jgi:hypothetical protein
LVLFDWNDYVGSNIEQKKANYQGYSEPDNEHQQEIEEEKNEPIVVQQSVYNSPSTNITQKSTNYTPLIIFIVILGFLGLAGLIIAISENSDGRGSNQPLTASNNATEKDRYGSYDPGMDNKFSKKERDYFNKIAKNSEYNGECEISRWKSDMKIHVRGEKRDYLMEELNKIVSELNEIIDPIRIIIVDDAEKSNYQILFGSEQDYNDLDPGSKEHTPDNWGLFIINSGKEIRRGTMYVDIYRCENINGQKHLLREELTQSLGLTHDTYDYPQSIFYQNWSETTEYAPIDITLIDMLYNHW